MEVVTGDRYLESLVKFVEKNAGPLIEGSMVLKLNPVGLHYVYSRLDALRELESLISGAPVDYLRAYISDLGDHRAIEQLRRILCRLTSLKVVSVLSSPARDPTPLYLLPFGRLKVLELRGCDLSTSAARGLLELRPTLEKFVCHNSTDALRHIFTSRISEIRDSPQWKRLWFVSCAFNRLVLMDESLQLLPSVEILDLSRNKFSKIDNLRKCAKLSQLDLGFNHLRSVAPFREISHIVKLVLRNNSLSSLQGIENLKSLEELDLSYNIMSKFSELEVLSPLPYLTNLWLEGNPFCCARWYRPQVFSYFAFPEKLCLDDEEISTREFWKRQIIIARRQTRPASYGFYSPAREDTEEEIRSRKTKKVSRLASIESEERKKNISDPDSISTSSGNEIHSGEEKAACIDDSEVSPLSDHVRDYQSDVNMKKYHTAAADLEDSVVSNYPRSPPHYQEDILVRLHDLEDEMMQLSADSFSLVSSDTDTSSDEDGILPQSHNNKVLQQTSQESLVQVLVGPEENSYAEQEDGNFEKMERKGKVKKRVIPLLSEDYVSANGVAHRDELNYNDCDQVKNIENCIEHYFNSIIANSGAQETCREFILCCCIVEQEMQHRERDMYVVLSSEGKLYSILANAISYGSGNDDGLVSCYKVEDISDILVGLGLQVVRVCVSGYAAFMYIIKSTETSTHFLAMLGANRHSSLRSLGCVQIDLFGKNICGLPNVCIFQYSMVYFTPDDNKDVQCVSRSLFVCQRHLFVCIEDFLQFSSLSENAVSSDYFLLDSVCSIADVSELVIEGKGSSCVTLKLEAQQSESCLSGIANLMKLKMKEKRSVQSKTWRFKWASEADLFNFVALLKAIHSGLATSALSIKCVS